jgi:F-type H+-transporting ATPase subunit a
MAIHSDQRAKKSEEGGKLVLEAITPTVVFELFGLPVRSTVIATWISMALIILVVIVLNKFKPYLLESLVHFLRSTIAGIMNIDNIDRYMPFLGTLIIFIAVANTLGAFPMLSSPTSDINTTIALSVLVLIVTHFFGISEKGFFKYSKEMASPIFLFPLEIVSQISRTISLALRLFGNILSGELIASIVFSLIPLFLPVPLLALSMLIGILQAYVFTALSSTYIASAIEASE